MTARNYFDTLYVLLERLGLKKEITDMPAIKDVTLSELQDLMRSLQLPADTRMTVTFEENQTVQKAWERRKALEAMRKLKGSGNGNLVAALLAEREKDAAS